MKDLLETGISWKNIKKKPKGDYRYQIRRASMEESTNTFFLEVCLNFVPEKEDEERIKALLCERLPKLSQIRVELKYEKNLNGDAHLLRKNQSAMPGLMLGNMINEKSTPIVELEGESDRVTIEGEIFSKKKRILKNGRGLLTFLISDPTESACVRVMTPKEKTDLIHDGLNEGDRIKVRGKYQKDKFEDANILYANDLERVAFSGRMDNAAVKRIELHAHTKMSALDGVADVEELIETAAAWGHEAVAITDHGVTQAFPDAAKYAAARELNIKIIYGLEGYLVENEENYRERSYHVILLAKNQKGLENLYKMVSASHLDYFYRRPRIPKPLLEKHREGIIVGSACEAGEIYQGLLERQSPEEMARRAVFYDYLEIQPLVNNRFLIDDGRVGGEDELKELNKKVLALGRRCGKPVVATCDAHYIEEREALYRRIIMAGQGYKDAERGEGLFLRTTEEMLEEFSYLGEDTAREVVIDNPRKIAHEIEAVAPVPEESFRPEIKNADKILREKCLASAVSLYGEPLPAVVGERLNRELEAIIGNGYSVLYVASMELVKESLRNGYIVGSRGSVGSSLAATMAGITEVNPLQPHYICKNPACKHAEFVIDEEIDCGVDLPAKKCPKCGENYFKDGYNIPFETFMGFKGNKEPDIDLNFAGEYQSLAHSHVEEIFGAENVYRAGTISKIAGKTAFGFVKKYYEENRKPVSKWEIERLTMKCTGVRRTTGQHPGGIVILPENHDIHEFCPVQRPANDVDSRVVTTHYDYHSIDRNLLKLDILGHDVPSTLRMLKDLTGIDPLNVPLDDPLVDSIFNGTGALNIRDEKYNQRHGTYGIPEFGTGFVRQMLDDIKPEYFSDLIRISGLSHGTDVWINNAQNVIREGKAAFQEVICTRDDIMNDLIGKGLAPRIAFDIMESVRKGRGLTEEEEEIMRKHGIPSWYIDSCKKIGYMFPKAHAVAYVIMSYRIAYYKVYYPLAFYASFFTGKVASFRSDIVLKGAASVNAYIDELTEKGRSLSQKEGDELTVLEVAREMLARGFNFENIDMEKSDSRKFMPTDTGIRLPFRAIAGIGDKAADNMALALGEKAFSSVDDLKIRAGLNKAVIESLKTMGLLNGLPESDQLSLF